MGVNATQALVLQPGGAEPGAAGADDRAAGAGRAARHHGQLRRSRGWTRLGAVVAAVLVLALNLRSAVADRRHAGHSRLN